jgi:hypothetical protein
VNFGTWLCHGDNISGLASHVLRHISEDSESCHDFELVLGREACGRQKRKTEQQ